MFATGRSVIYFLQQLAGQVGWLRLIDSMIKLRTGEVLPASRRASSPFPRPSGPAIVVIVVRRCRLQL